MNPYLATLFTFLIALTLLRLMDFLAHQGIIESIEPQIHSHRHGADLCLMLVDVS